MNIETDRFGTIELDANEIIRIPGGLLGLPRETSFVLLRNHPASAVGWLQSTRTPGLALPVATVDALAYDYPEISQLELRQAGLQPGNVAVMAVLYATGATPATVNLVAPIVVNTETREGAQVLRHLSGWSARQPFALRVAGDEVPAEAPREQPMQAVP